MANKKEIGQRIREARLAMRPRQSQLDISDGIPNLTQSHYSKLERGEASVNNETMQIIARKLDIPVEDLLGIDTAVPAPGERRLDKPVDIVKNTKLPKGLRELAADKKLIKAHDIKPEEWLWMSTQRPTSTDASGYLSLLIIRRAVSNH